MKRKQKLCEIYKIFKRNFFWLIWKTFKRVFVWFFKVRESKWKYSIERKKKCEARKITEISIWYHFIFLRPHLFLSLSLSATIDVCKFVYVNKKKYLNCKCDPSSISILFLKLKIHFVSFDGGKNEEKKFKVFDFWKEKQKSKKKSFHEMVVVLFSYYTF